jgi:epoxyqueuosine reductase
MPISISEEERAGAEPVRLASWLKRRAAVEGFDTAGIAGPKAIETFAAHLHSFLKAGFHGEMEWLAANAERRSAPTALWPDVRSIAMLGLNYGPRNDPLAALADRSRGAVSVYAQGADYHDVIKSKLKAVARDFAEKTGAQVKVFVDTAPVMEKPLAQAAGLGWMGKHTNLVSRDFGSWLFLGAIFTTADIDQNPPEADHCGGCRRCLDICPTDAFPAPYRLDARRCISYLTIEHKGQIAAEFREAMGNRIYGCDDCLAVCPWNKFAQSARELRLAPRDAANNPPLSELLALDDHAFRERFRGSPIKRIGRTRFLRNVLVAAGNSGDPGFLHHISPHLRDEAPIVRGMAVWAVRRIARGADPEPRLRSEFYLTERDEGVRREWEQAL